MLDSDKSEKMVKNCPKETIQSYDGITKTLGRGLVFTSYNIFDALQQGNPRNVFLNGQLHIEMSCDLLLSQYFCSGDSGFENRRRGLFSEFLKSREMNYFTKINLLKRIEVFDGSYPDNKLVDSKLLCSLKAIGAVRNAFHHHLDYEEALRSLTNGDKFMFCLQAPKKLSDFTSVESLTKDFRSEAYSANDALHDLSLRLGEYLDELNSKQ